MTTIYNQYKTLSRAVYEGNGNATVDETLQLNRTLEDGTSVTTQINSSGQNVYSTSSGMQAVAFRNAQNEIVIAYRGTELNDIGDVSSDINILLGNIPQAQLTDAENFYKAVVAQYGDENIVITGHSLGGAIAQIIGSKTGKLTYTYNAPGMATYSGIYPDVVKNFVVMNDYVGMYGDHVGETYYIQPIPIDREPWLDTHNGIFDYSLAINGEIYSNLDGFETSEGLSLWYYDKNNNLSTLNLDNISSFVSIDALENAINIINNQIGTPLHKLHYTTNNGDYIIDVNTGSSDLKGKYINDTYGMGTYDDNFTDIIWGNGGNDLINGLGGNDTLIGDSTTYKIAELKNKEELFNSLDLSKFESENDGADNIDGGNGDDLIFGGGGNATIDGGDDKDFIFGGTGNDSIEGGSGEDIIIGGQDQDIISGGNGNDVIFGDYNNSNINELKNIKNTINDDSIYGDNFLKCA